MESSEGRRVDDVCQNESRKKRTGSADGRAAGRGLGPGDRIPSQRLRAWLRSPAEHWREGVSQPGNRCRIRFSISPSRFFEVQGGTQRKRPLVGWLARAEPTRAAAVVAKASGEPCNDVCISASC